MRWFRSTRKAWDRCMKKYLVNKKRLTLQETGKSYTSTYNLFLDGWKTGVEDTFPVSGIKRSVDVNTDMFRINFLSPSSG